MLLRRNFQGPRANTTFYVDGVAPRAKMNQQRSRRFRSAQDAKTKDEDNAVFVKMLKSQNGDAHEFAESVAQKKTWDSNAITPGTPFMDILAASLRFWAAYKVNTDHAWAKVCSPISLIRSPVLICIGQNHNFRRDCSWRRRA